MAKAKQKKAEAKPKKQPKVKKAPKAAKKKENKKPAVAEKKETRVEIKEKELGEVTNYFEHVQAAAIKLEAPLNAGDTIHVKGGEVDFEQKVTSMQINRVPVSSAKKGDEVGIRVNQHVRKGYKVYLK
jgi:putative protease